MFLKLTTDNCEYRGEGNTGLVICLKKEGKVLRLIKQEGSYENAKNAERLLHQMENEILMIKNVMKPLLGNDLVNCPVIVALQADDVKLLNSIVNLMRPSNRTHKNVKEEKTYGLLLPDYCTLPAELKSYSSGPVLSIEIKPKPGALLAEKFFDSSHSEQSKLFCHFCRKQIYKMRVDGVSPKSSYCPTDLFSGCPKRMQHALKMLLQTPQNNLRIFKDQKIIYSNEKRCDLEETLCGFFNDSKYSCVDALIKLVIAVLLNPISCKPKEIFEALNECDILTCANAHPECIESGFHVLPRDCVLQRVLNLQLLDKLDIQTVYSLLNMIRKSNDETSNSIGCYSRSEIPPHLGEKQKAKSESDYQYASRKVWEFIMALVAKDCSIMLVLSNYEGEDIKSANLVSDDFGNQYMFSMAVLDLDTKPLSRIEKHYKRTPLWIQACSNVSV
ncbi:inositol-pentakisphosphate 2-kinase isoform X2 [Parasteatoda tepidariorum]|uniref:inositol-pentakisphosphate 2-kinase isoform X2 n=2 Tax=Parasteatoda tepidariorum TaxID=114398 RepID=UPI001C72055C|nr:inositol-pentakisphosphate 2-kinase isoform X2 [Parasteatoda tepidariorum]